MKKVAAKEIAVALRAEYQNKHNLNFILKFKGGKNPITFKFSVGQEKVCFLVLFEMTFFQQTLNFNKCSFSYYENNSAQPLL